MACRLNEPNGPSNSTSVWMGSCCSERSKAVSRILVTISRCSTAGAPARETSYAAVGIGFRRIDQSKVNILPSLKLEPGWLVEVKARGAVAAFFLVLQPRFVFCGNHARHGRNTIKPRMLSRVQARRDEGRSKRVVITNQFGPWTIVQDYCGGKRWGETEQDCSAVKRLHLKKLSSGPVQFAYSRRSSTGITHPKYQRVL